MKSPFATEFLETDSEFEEEAGLLDAELEYGLLGEVNRKAPSYVRWVQKSLNQILGIRLAEDGIMGPATRSAIRSFQQRHGLTADGIVGPQTERALIAAGASPPPGNAAPPAPAPAPGRLAPAPTPVNLAEVVQRGLRLLAAQQHVGYSLYPEATRRLQCLLGMILEPGVDDRYVNGLSFLVQSVTRRLSPEQFAVLISHVKTDLMAQCGPTESDRKILVMLELLDSRIFYGIAFMNRHVATHGAASSPGMVQIKDWMAGRQRDRNSIYSCYSGVRY